jgi:hypothetical protein
MYPPEFRQRAVSRLRFLCERNPDKSITSLSELVSDECGACAVSIRSWNLNADRTPVEEASDRTIHRPQVIQPKNVQELPV